MNKRIQIRPNEAAMIAGWITTRGGVARWASIDMSDLKFGMLTPVNQANGQPSEKPHWKLESAPSVVITTLTEVDVCDDKEVKRFRVGVRLRSNGYGWKVTDGGSRRINSAIEKAGEGAYHEFDYETQEAIIYAPASVVPLDQFLETKK